MDPVPRVVDTVTGGSNIVRITFRVYKTNRVVRITDADDSLYGLHRPGVVPLFPLRALLVRRSYQQADVARTFRTQLFVFYPDYIRHYPPASEVLQIHINH